MGSTFAGVKAGILASIVYSGLVSAFYLTLLYIFNSDVMSSMATIPECAGQVGECFATLVTTDLPTFILFPLFALLLIFSGLYGWMYEYLPGVGYKTKALSAGLAGCIFFIFLSGVYFLVTIQIFDLMIGFMVAMTVVFAYTLGFFFKRYTRVVEFTSDNPGGVKVMMGKSDVTGKNKTFSYRSSHSVRASAQAKATFKEWLSSGGVSVADPKSFETEITVNGDGMLKARTS